MSFPLRIQDQEKERNLFKIIRNALIFGKRLHKSFVSFTFTKAQCILNYFKRVSFRFLIVYHILLLTILSTCLYLLSQLYTFLLEQKITIPGCGPESASKLHVRVGVYQDRHLSVFTRIIRCVYEEHLSCQEKVNLTMLINTAYRSNGSLCSISSMAIKRYDATQAATEG